MIQKVNRAWWGAGLLLGLVAGGGLLTAGAAPELEPPSGFDPGIRAEDIRAQVRYLASDALEGRGSGTPGGQKAAAFIAEQFRAAGLQPMGAGGSYFQSFRFTAGVSLGQKNALTLRRGSSPGQS